VLTITNQKNASKIEAITHIVKSYLGIGILTLPVAFSNAGVVGGSIGLIITMFISVNCANILANAAIKLAASREISNMDYANTAETAFLEAGGTWARMSKYMGYLINCFLLLTQIGNSSVYILFVAKNLMPIIESELSLGWDYRHYLAVLFIPILLICSIKNLKYLSPLTIIANILELLGLAIIFYFIFYTPFPNIDTVPLFSSAKKFPIFFGTAIFAFGGITVVLPVQSQMTKPKEMLGVTGATTISIVLCGVFYLAMGFCGYVKYGSAILPSISFNLPAGDPIAQACQAMFALAVFFSYALQFYVVMDIITKDFINKHVSENWRIIVEFGVRFMLNACVFGLAATVPWMDLLVSLISCLTCSFLSIMVPALIDMAISWNTESGTKFWLRLVKNTILFIVGFLALIIGSYISVMDIVKKFNSGPEENP